MIAVDSNVLVYAHRTATPDHVAADTCIRTLIDSGEPWAIPWPCVHEFLGVVTHPRIWTPPSTRSQALAQIAGWQSSGTLALLAESAGYWEIFAEIVEQGDVAGPRIHDARIAALCRLHGVRELWSADRDFSRFPSLKVRNPLVGRK